MRRKTLSRNSKSDHLTIVNAFQVKQPTSVISCLSSLSSVWMDACLKLSSIDCIGLGGSKTAWCQVWEGVLLGQLPVCQYTPGEPGWLRVLCWALHWSALKIKPGVVHDYIFRVWLLSGQLRACSLFIFRSNLSFYHSDAAQHEGSVCWTSDACRLCQQQGPQRSQI